MKRRSQVKSTQFAASASAGGSGLGAYAAATDDASSDRKGEHQGKRQQKRDGGDRSPSPGEEKKRLRKKKIRLFADGRPPRHTAKTCQEEISRTSHCRSPIVLVGAREEEQTSTPKVCGEEEKKKPKPSSGEKKPKSSGEKKKKRQPKPSSCGELGKIALDEDEQPDKKQSSGHLGKMVAQDEDEQPDKKRPSGDLGKMAHDEDQQPDKKHPSGDLGETIAQDEDEQRSDKIGLPAIEDHEQEQGLGGSVQALLDMDDDTLSAKTFYYFDKLKSDLPDDRYDWPEYEPQQLTEVYEQLALYRIRAYLLLLDLQSAELDDADLKKLYPSEVLRDKGYFKSYEESLEWYFDPELCERPELDHYQGLVLYNDGEYLDWDCYHSTLNTYEKDLAYVQYCEALANGTKWIQDYLANNPHELQRIQSVAFLQALRIATGFPNVSGALVIEAFNEHMWSILFDNANYKGMDGVYFEIWKRVAKLKKIFGEALSELHREDMFPFRTLEIEYEIKNNPRRFSMKDNYDAYVAAYIDGTTSEDKARQFIIEAVRKMVTKPKIHLDYAKKKLDIAKDIQLIQKVTPQRRGDSEAKVATDN